MKCPKCGYENRDSAHFCSECGADLSTEKFLCPQCGDNVNKGEKHCSNCGKELAWVDADYSSIPIPANLRKTSAAKSYNPHTQAHSTKNNVVRYIFGCVFILAILLLFIGCFGDFVKGNISLLETKYKEGASSLTYYFKTIYSDIKDIREADQYGYYYGFELFLMFIDVLFYYSMLILVVTFAVLSTINLIRYMMNMSELKTSYLIIMLFAVLGHLMVVELRNFVGVFSAGEGSISVSFGWGSVLLLIGSILILCFVLSDRFISTTNTKKVQGVVGSSLSALSDIFSFVLLLLVLGFIIRVNDSNDLLSMPISSSFVLRYVHSTYTGSYNYYLDKAYSIGGPGFVVLLSFTALYLVNFVISLIKDSIVKPIVNGVAFVGVIIGEALMLSAADYLFPTNTTFSAGGIFVIILGFFSLGVSIASYVLKKRA